MQIEYKIEENDFLAYQLFTASKSKRINQRKKKETYLIFFASLLLGVYFYFQSNVGLVFYCCSVAVLTLLFYSKYYNWKYKQHYKKFIQENYSNRFGEQVELSINDDFLYSKDKTGEGKIKLEEIEVINETENHFFIKISTGTSLIIPKDSLKSSTDLKSKFDSLGSKIETDLNWNWR